MRGIMEATCSRCGSPMHWDTKAPRVCAACGNQQSNQRREESPTAAPASTATRKHALRSTPASLASPAPLPAEKRCLPSWLLSLISVVFLVALTLGTAGCDLGPTGSPSSSTSATFTPTPITPHRAKETIFYSPEFTDKEPATLVAAANTYLAASLDAAVVPNQDGVTVYIEPITATTYDTAASGAWTLQIPATQPEPNPPQLDSVPPIDPNDYYPSLAKHNAALSENAKRIAAYQTALQNEQAQLAQVRATVKEQSDKLRHFNVAVSTTQANQASVWGAALKASQTLAPATNGSRWWIAASAWDETEWVDRAPLQLSGVTVRGIWMYCQMSTTCQYRQRTWHDALSPAGVTDLKFYDPQQSSVLPPLLSGAPGI